MNLAVSDTLRMRETNVWNCIEFRGVRVPIYRDIIQAKNGNAVARYRVPVSRGAATRFRAFQGEEQQDRARRFALETAKKLADTHQFVQTPDGNDFIWMAQREQERLGAIGWTLVRAVEEFVSCITILHRAYPEGGGPSLRELAVNEAQKAQIDAKITPQTVSQVAAAYIEVLKALLEREELTDGQYKRARAEAQRFAAAFGSRMVHLVQAHELTRWFASRTGPAYTTMCQYRSELRKIFDFARDHLGALAPDQRETAADRTRIRRNRPQAPTRSIGIYSAAEVERIMRCAHANRTFRRWLPALVLWFYGGIHFSEMLRLRFSAICDHNVRIGKETSLRHRERLVVLSPAAYTWIAPVLRLAALRGLMERPILPGLDLEAPLEAQYGTLHRLFQAAFKAILAEADVPFKANGLRHSLCSHLFVLTNSAEYVSLQAGSAQATLLKFYFAAVSPEDALDYFRVARPGSGDFAGLLPVDWLPSWVCKSRVDAIADINRALARKESGRKWQGRSK